MKNFGIIMAGGDGTRLWPLSREKRPKQISQFLGEKTLLEETLERISGIFDPDNIYLSINRKQQENCAIIAAKGTAAPQLLVQPANRNNAPFVLYMAMKIIHCHGNGVVCLFPADHKISDGAAFERDIRRALCYAADNHKIVAIGTQPDYPAQTYGYLKLEKGREGIGRVKEFTEKPSEHLAGRYLASGEYLWNTGIYVWTAEKIVNSFKRYLPKLHHVFLPIIPYLETEREQEMLAAIYQDVADISIDYGIMEQTDDLWAFEGCFDWADIGSYEAIDHLFAQDADGNRVKAEYLNIDSKNNLIVSDRQVVTTVGIENMIVIVDDDVVLVCPKHKTADIKYLIEKLRKNKCAGIL